MIATVSAVNHNRAEPRQPGPQRVAVPNMAAAPGMVAVPGMAAVLGMAGQDKPVVGPLWSAASQQDNLLAVAPPPR